MSHKNVGRLGILEYNSFRWRAIRLFNQLPLFLRNVTVCSRIPSTPRDGAPTQLIQASS